MSDEKQNGGQPAGDSNPELSNAEPRMWGEDGGGAPGVPPAVPAPEPPGPTHADWRQLSDEVRRLAAQIAHGRA